MGVKLDIVGHIRAIIRNEDTGRVRECEFYNKATNALLNRIAQCLADQPMFGIAQFQMGTGTGTVSATDTHLFTATAGSLISVAAKSSSSNSTSITINYPKNYVTGSFTEGGLLDKNGILLTHFLLSPTLQIVANESVTFIYTITINAT